jgi:outer membrane protein OmpA-like peptidoglycan-associated protein
MGSLQSNIQLGQRRANIVKQYLIGREVHGLNIIAESKGETQPTSGAYVNNKKSADNRRTELQITK